MRDFYSLFEDIIAWNVDLLFLINIYLNIKKTTLEHFKLF